MSGDRFQVIERSPDLWRVLDRWYLTIDYIVFGDRGGFAIVPVSEELDRRDPDVREFTLDKGRQRVAREEWKP